MRFFIQGLKISLAQYLAYRLNFILWRVRNFLGFLLMYFFWKAVFSNNLEIAGYTSVQIFSYLVISTLISDLVFSTATGHIAGLINSGELNRYLLLPKHFFSIIGVKEVVDKLVNIFFSIIEVSLFILIFKIPVQITLDLSNLFVLILILSSVVIMNFFMSLIISFVGFWSNEVWAPRFLFSVLISTLSGAYFPLDVLPEVLLKILKALPFSLLVFTPTQLITGKLDPAEGSQTLVFATIWTIIFFFFAVAIWRKGLKNYSAQGI